MHPDQIDAVAPTDRRRFLKVGGAGALAAAFLAACGSDEESPPSETGVTLGTTTTIAPAQTTVPAEGEAQTITVARTMRSVELAAVEAYGVLLGEGGGELALPAPIPYSEDVSVIIGFLRGRHQAHAATLVGLILDVGGEPVSEPNNGVIEGLFAPAVPSMTTEAAVLRTIITMEDVIASTYAWGTGTVPDAALRAEMMTIGGPSARQAAAARMLRDPRGVLVVTSATLDVSGPARLPDHMLVLEGMDGGDVPAEPVAEPEEGAEGEEGTEGEDREAEGGAEGEGGEGAESGTTETTAPTG
jgi:hypothetical protein